MSNAQYHHRCATAPLNAFSIIKIGIDRRLFAQLRSFINLERFVCADRNECGFGLDLNIYIMLLVVMVMVCDASHTTSNIVLHTCNFTSFRH